MATTIKKNKKINKEKKRKKEEKMTWTRTGCIGARK